MMKLPRQFTQCLLVFLAATMIVVPQRAKADPGREFIMSCTYGVLAGTLVGAATLAFSDKPGDNLNKVARGASLGLYAGILLGLYVVYGVPSEDEDVMVQNLDPLKMPADSLAKVKAASQPKPAPAALGVRKVALIPIIGQKGIEGGAVAAQVLSF